MEFQRNNYFLHSVILFVTAIFVNCKELPKTYSSYRPSPFCDPSDYMRYPKNSDEVVAIVKEAIRRGVKVKAFGSRHSQTDIICTDGIPVDMSKIRFSKMNADHTAIFGAGITLGEAGKFLYKNGRALRVTPAYKGITLGGALGTGAHGSSIKYNSTISQQVISMTVVNGRGDKIVISDPEDLKSFKVHLGLLGIVVDVTLFTVPLYKILAHNYVVSDDVLTNGDAVNWAKTEDHINFWWFPTFKQVVVANLTFLDVHTTGEAYSNAIVPNTYGLLNVIFSKAKEIVYGLTSSECGAASALGNTIGHVFELVALSSLTKKIPSFVPIYTEDGKSLKNPAAGYAHSMLATSCNDGNAGVFGTACIWAHGKLRSNITLVDNEIGIALHDLPEFIKQAKDITKKTPTAFPLQGVWIRFSGKSDIHMAQGYQKDIAHVEFAFVKRIDSYNKATGSLAGYQSILQTLAHKFNGRSHWGKTGAAYHSKEMIRLKLDEDAREKFVAAMGKFDPDRIFMNNFGLRLLQNGTKMDLDPKITRCALLDNCFCSKDGDCARSQSCTTLPGYDDFPVCKTKNEEPEVQFDRNLFPHNVNLLNWLASALPSIAAGVFSKCSLSGLIFETVPNIIGSALG